MQSRIERFCLYAALTALTALAIDGVLPAMPLIESAFESTSPVSTAQIMTTFVLGMAFGELVIGPISDALGRRPAVISGIMIFIIGTILAATADSFSTVIIGRFLQGIGVAGPKIGTRAMIRDWYTGADMARILSMIFTLLILVPMIAPALGALIASVSGWRGIFWSYLALAIGLGAWLWRRHPETLPAERRVSLNLPLLSQNIGKLLLRRDVMPIVIATGFVFGAQLTYFAVAANLFSDVYGIPKMMPGLFALLATGTALALLLNVWLVSRTGMEAPIFVGLVLLGLSGAGLMIAAILSGAHPSLSALLGLVWLGFFGLGLLFGNLNAFAMRPLGELAGLGSSIIASVSSLVAFCFVTAVEALITAPVWALAWAFSLAASLAAVFILLTIPAISRKKFLRSVRHFR